MAFVNELMEPARPAPEHIGPEAIRHALKTIPHAPGVYRMISAEGTLLYVGKAKDLQKRVTSYALARDLSTRILIMVSQVAYVETTVTRSEAEALLVEANYIRRGRPRYNILLKDDKSFPQLLIGSEHAYPRIEKHRGAQSKKGEYFGPFASVRALNDTLALLQRIFLLRPCSDSYFKNRTRPCLQYQIKRCSAPCVGYISEAEYAAKVASARDFLHGKHRDVQDQLAAEMQAASAAMDYEYAAVLRDRIRALTAVQQEQGLRTAGLTDADVIALARRGARSVVQVFFFRQGSNFGHQSFQPRHEADATEGEILAAFLAQFYQAHTPPPEILVNLEPTECHLLTEALSLQVGQKITIRQPQRGDKLTLVSNAAAQAQAALERVEMERISIEANLLAVQKLFDLPRVPQRIEVYDNSHIMGQNAVGAFIVATPDGFDKKSYRTYTIKQAAGNDDYGMMREVFSRRFKKESRVESRESSGAQVAMPGTPSPLAGEGWDEGAARLSQTSAPLTQPSPARGEGYAPDARLSTLDSSHSLPDLVLIDGGIGQLNAVMEVVKELGVTGVTFVGIAKGVDRNAGREWFHMPGREPFQLPVNDPTLHYLQRVRDEVHRFVIGRHRKKRSAALTTSALDDIPGIGATRKRALLQHFGSRADVEVASLAELENVKGISKSTARAIYDFFH